MDFTRKRLRRLQELHEQRPQFAEIFDFYTHLYTFLDAPHSSFLQAFPDPENREMKLREGFPLLTGNDLRIDGAQAALFLSGLVEVLRTRGQQGEDDLARLAGALEDGTLVIDGLFRACLDRERRKIEAEALRIGVPPAILEYVLDTALSYALQRAREEGLDVSTQDWKRGYCPLCGGVPAMGELTAEDGSRRLHCATCATAWSYPRLSCAACGNTDPDTLEYFTAEGQEGYRVDVCRRCSCYLKVADSRNAPATERPMDIEDVSTLHLDLLAQKEGFTRGKKAGP